MTYKGELLLKTRAGVLYEKQASNIVRCFACAHKCTVKDGRQGICRVRTNRAGELLVPWGYVAGLQVDPIEKKPFFHVHPGAETVSFGMLGCNFHCSFCQNWLSSQTLRDESAQLRPDDISVDQVIAMADSCGSCILTSTYNEPLISIEWAVEVFRAGKSRGMKGAIVSNGYATEQSLTYLRPYVDFIKIDLKTFDDHKYRQLGGRLPHVLDAIHKAHAMGFWLEIVTLLIPSYNDDEAQLRALTKFLVSVSESIPWHVTAFHADYRMQSPNTQMRDLLRAAEIGKEEGLKFVYAGNIAGIGDWENN